MNSIYTTVILLVVLMTLLTVVTFLRKLKRIKREKVQGLSDFIDEEYIDFLTSSESELNVVRNLVITYKSNQEVYNLKGDLFFNKAGVYIKLNDKHNSGLLQNSIFVFGSEKPSSFSPRSQYYFVSIEFYESSLTLVLRKVKESKKSNFKVELKDVSHSIYNKLNTNLKPVCVYETSFDNKKML